MTPPADEAEAEADVPAVKQVVLDPAWTVTGDEYWVAPVASVTSIVIEVPAAMLTVHVYDVSEVGWASMVVMTLRRARDVSRRIDLWLKSGESQLTFHRAGLQGWQQRSREQFQPTTLNKTKREQGDESQFASSSAGLGGECQEVVKGIYLQRR